MVRLTALMPAKILLVEDDLDVRMVLLQILKNGGHNTVATASGSEAIAAWQTHSTDIWLLITDIIMPGKLTGWDLAEHFWEERPDLRVIFTSGYAKSFANHQLTSARHSLFLQKPYGPDVFLRAVSSLLATMSLNPPAPPAAPSD